jgi:copper chaperone CopZ
MRRRLGALICVSLCSLTVSACATTTSTSSFKGAEHDVAQALANLQSDVTSGEQKKICANELSAALVTRLGGKAKCEAAVKEQLTEVDSTELQVESVKVSGSTATASVKTVYSGKKHLSTVSLMEEGGKWKISALR